MNFMWVFGYGSLMWNPGFDFVRKEDAVLHGAHRSLCVYSYVHRGTPENPGLVLGLDRGGSCKGTAFAVHPKVQAETLDYLRKREQINMVYKEEQRKVRLASGETVTAIAYLVNREHQQYAGKIDLETQYEIVARSQGQSGHNRDYVVNTSEHLDSVGTSDPALAWLSKKFDQ